MMTLDLLIFIFAIKFLKYLKVEFFFWFVANSMPCMFGFPSSSSDDPKNKKIRIDY